MDIHELTDAINKAPYSSDAYLNRGAEYFKQKKFTEALIDFGKAIGLNPLSAIAYYDRALCYRNEYKDYNLALIDLDKAIELDDIFYSAYVERCKVNMYLEKYDDAIADSSKAIELSPNESNNFVNRAAAYLKGFQLHKQAINDLNQAIIINPDCAVAYLNRGSAYAEGFKDYDKSVTDFKKVIELDPNCSDAYLGIGLSYYKMGMHKDAITNWIQAYKLGNENAKKLLNTLS